MNDKQNDVERLSGLELLKEMIAGRQRSPMADTADMRLIAVADGSATFEAHPSEKFYNPQRRVHGGYTATLLDSAMGCAVQTRMAPGVAFGTVELQVNFVRKIDVSTGRLICTGTVLHSGRTMSTAEAKVLDGKGKLYAHGSGTFLVYPK
ncbi:MAG: PaaI family thioesterase [Aestuariivirga sp.]